MGCFEMLENTFLPSVSEPSTKPYVMTVYKKVNAP